MHTYAPSSDDVRAAEERAGAYLKGENIFSFAVNKFDSLCALSGTHDLHLSVRVRARAYSAESSVPAPPGIR